MAEVDKDALLDKAIEEFNAGGDATSGQESTSDDGGVQAAPTSDDPLAADNLAKLEAQVREEIGEEAKPQESDEKKPATEGSRLKKLIDTKYAGDEDKFVDGLYEQWNSASQLKKELESLREEFKSAKTEKQAEKIEDLPEVVEAKQELDELDRAKQLRVAKQVKLLNRIGSLEIEIAQKKGELKYADEFDKSSVAAEISNLIQRKEYEEEKFEALKEELDSFGQYRKRAERNIALAAKAAEARKQDELEKAEVRNAVKRQTLETFHATVDASFKEFGIPDDPELRQELSDNVRYRTIEFLQTRGEGSTVVDITDFVKQRMAKEAKMYGFGKKEQFTDFSKKKLETVALRSKTPEKVVPAPRPPASSTQQRPSGDKQSWSSDFARARAAKILG